MHLTQIHRIVGEFDPALVVIDPVSSLLHSGSQSGTAGMLLRLVDFLKGKAITAMMTTLTARSDTMEQSGLNISSLVDAWLLLRDIEMGGERNRGLYILKARGIAHSNQIQELQFTNHGIELRNVYLGEAGLLTGSARVAQEARDASGVLAQRQEIERKQLLLDRKRKILEAQIAALQLDLECEGKEVQQLMMQGQQMATKVEEDRARLAISRFANQGIVQPIDRIASIDRSASALGARN
jgi:circadian clock protein KaiC